VHATSGKVGVESNSVAVAGHRLSGGVFDCEADLGSFRDISASRTIDDPGLGHVDHSCLVVQGLGVYRYCLFRHLFLLRYDDRIYLMQTVAFLGSERRHAVVSVMTPLDAGTMR